MSWLCVCPCLVVLQGSSSAEHPSSPSSAGAQQPRDRHSFVQEHFQAQYRWETPQLQLFRSSFCLRFNGVMLFTYRWRTTTCLTEEIMAAALPTLLWIQCIYIFSLSRHCRFVDSRSNRQTTLKFDEHLSNKLGLYAIIVTVNQLKPTSGKILLGFKRPSSLV